MTSALSQSTYQVRFEWGVAGLQRLAATDVVVVVDVLRFSSVVSERVAAGERMALADLHARSINGAVVAACAAAQEHRPVVLAGALRNAGAVASTIRQLQQDRGGRVSVAVIACGERESRAADALVRFAMEDQLGAGAIIDALGDLGIDHTAPEAAVAAEAFRSLRHALRHLIGASGSGRELIDRDESAVTAAAVALNADAVAPQLRDGVFVGAATQ